MDNYNPRGHAFVTFKNGYNKMTSWQWFKLAQEQAMVPTYTEYIKQALDIYDRIMINEPQPTRDRNREVVFEIHNTLTGSMEATIRGAFRYKTVEGGRIITPKDRLHGGSADMDDEFEWTHEERGYSYVTGNLMVSSVIQALAHRLSENELRMLVAYVDGEYGDTWKAVADGLGLTRRQQQSALYRIRKEAKQAGLLEVMV